MGITFKINSVTFKSPSSISRYEDDFKRYAKDRAVDGSQLVDIISSTKKTRMLVHYQVLLPSQLTALKPYIETGSYLVEITDTDYAYSANSFIELDGGWKESYGGSKEDITLRITEM